MIDRESRLELLAHVASLYYDHHKNQQEIAEEIGVTRSAVSRLLGEAHNVGIVEHIIHYPQRTVPVLEKALTAAFDLKYVRVLSRQMKTYEEMLKGLGNLAAQYFTSILPNISIVGITWGTGLYHRVKAFRPQLRPDMEIVQVIGCTGTEKGSAIGPLLAPNLANSLGCSCRFLHAPILIRNVTARNALLQDRSIRETLEIGEKCDIALVGIGAITPELYNPYLLGYVTREELEQMNAEGIIGDVAFLHYNIYGEVLVDSFINQLAIGIGLEAIRKIPLVMAVAGGHQKGEGILGALRGKLVNALITDDTAARRVLELNDQFPPPV